jgi:hypothetical protein
VEVQVFGSEDDDGEIRFADTIGEAFASTVDDPSIWKISWTNKETDEPVRLVRRRSVVRAGKARVVKGPYVWIFEPMTIPLETDALPDKLTSEHFLEGEA